MTTPNDLVKATEHLHQVAVLKLAAQKKLEEAQELAEGAKKLGPHAAGMAALARAMAAQEESKRLFTEAKGHLQALASIGVE